MAEQDRLFDPGPVYDGPLSVRQFFDQAQWHATDEDEHPRWADEVREAGVPVHSGTAAAATDTSVGAYGARYPVRPLRPTQDVYPDRVANAADQSFRRSRGIRSSDSVNTSATSPKTPGVQGAVNDLAQGRSVRYINTHEDKGSISHVSPPGGFETLRDTTNFHEVPNAREYLTAREARHQGLPVFDRYEERTTYPWKDARLFEGVEGDRAGEETWYHGEDVQSMITDSKAGSKVHAGLGDRTLAGNIRPSVVSEGRLGELFRGMRTL